MWYLLVFFDLALSLFLSSSFLFSFSVCCLARHHCDTTVMVRCDMLTFGPHMWLSSFSSRRTLSHFLSFSFLFFSLFSFSRQIRTSEPTPSNGTIAIFTTFYRTVELRHQPNIQPNRIRYLPSPLSRSSIQNAWINGYYCKR